MDVESIDWPALDRALWAAVAAHAGRVEESAAEYAGLIREALRASGYVLTDEAAQYVTDWIDAAESLIRDGIAAALLPYAAATVAEGMRSQWIAERTAEAYGRRWPDGLRLSDRVWQWSEATRRGVSQALADAVATNRATSSATMDLQRAIEAASGQRFKLETRLVEDWADRLHAAGRRAVRDRAGMEAWVKAVAEARAHVDTLTDGGTRRQAEHALKEIRRAVAAGERELADRALEWWLYDRQKYSLARVVRTEMATAGHRAVIASGADDPEVIGYRWRLSGSHPEPDICDWYAGVDFGMGAGVWPADRVPDGKAHPHCMCSLTPTTRPMRRDGVRGAEDLGVFFERMSASQREAILPAWARELRRAGVPWGELMRSDGTWIASKREVRERLGELRFAQLSEAGRGGAAAS